MKSTTIFGTRAIIEAIQAEKSIEKVYLLKGIQNTLIDELTSLINKNKIAVSYVPKEKLIRLSKDNTHQGAVAIISQVIYQDLETLLENTEINSKSTFLLLDGITDVRNFGAIIRTAECTNCTAIIIPKNGSASLNSDAIKTSAGAAFNIPICKVNHLKDALFLLQAYDVKSVAATEKAEDLIYEIDVNQPIALIMGSEEKGIQTSILKLADYQAKIPILGKTESLNVSVACGAFLYEVVRQRL